MPKKGAGLSAIEFNRQEKADLVSRIRKHLLDELDCEVSGLQGEMFLDFLSEELGPRFYNRGLNDALTAVKRRMEDAASDIDILEKTIPR